MEKKGISLITLIITIIVVMILAAAILLTMAKNNPVKQADIAVFKQDVAVMQNVLNLAIGDITLECMDSPTLYMDESYTEEVMKRVRINKDSDKIGKLYYTTNTERGCIVFGNPGDIVEEENIAYRYTEQALPVYKNRRLTWYVTHTNRIVLEGDGIEIEEGKMSESVIKDIEYRIEGNILTIKGVLENTKGVGGIQYKIEEEEWSETKGIEEEQVIDITGKESIKVVVRAESKEGNEVSKEVEKTIILKPASGMYVIEPGEEIIFPSGVSYTATEENENMVLEENKVKAKEEAKAPDKMLMSGNGQEIQIYVSPKVEEGEYIIETGYDLERVGFLIRNKKERTQNMKVVADLDLSPICSEELGSWEPIGSSAIPYTGTFHGNYHKVEGLYINNNLTYQGLFGYNSGTISKITLESGTILNVSNYSRWDCWNE